MGNGERRGGPHDGVLFFLFWLLPFRVMGFLTWVGVTGRLVCGEAQGFRLENKIRRHGLEQAIPRS